MVTGRPTLSGPGQSVQVTLESWRRTKRLQEMEFELACTLTRAYSGTPRCEVPPAALFPQILGAVRRFVREKVIPGEGYDRKDVFLNPYYGWVVETLTEHIYPDTESGEAPEIPIYEAHRGPGSTADVDFWTAREPHEVTHSHLNQVVPDTKTWEQSAAYYLDHHGNVISFAKNAGVGFAIPYSREGIKHDYLPDFLARLDWNGREVGTLILETKGYDPLAEVKKAGALRWVAALNADGQYGLWDYRMARNPGEVPALVKASAEHLASLPVYSRNVPRASKTASGLR